MHLNSEDDEDLVRMKIPISALGRINLRYCGMHVPRISRACIIGILCIVGVIYIMYLVFSKVTAIILNPKMYPTSRGGIIICFILILPSFLLALISFIIMFKRNSVVLLNVKYVTYNPPMTPSKLMIDALHILPICMPQHHESIQPRAKMGIFVHTKFASSSEFKCDSNTLIFSLIGCQLSELHDFYKQSLIILSSLRLIHI